MPLLLVRWDAIYMMDGKSQLKVCECALLCIYKCTRACKQHFLLTRNCATLFIRRREIWKLLPAHLRALRVSLATSSGGGVGLSGAFAKYASPATERESTSSEDIAPLGLVRLQASGRDTKIHQADPLDNYHFNPLSLSSGGISLQDAFLILALNCLSTRLGPQFLERLQKQRAARFNLHELQASFSWTWLISIQQRVLNLCLLNKIISWNRVRIWFLQIIFIVTLSNIWKFY